jgi:AcrR family transcriptional regulator
VSQAAVKAPDSRQRFIDVAVRLFVRHSFAGTSLQMIADELGVTKSAVYHHFHTREEMLSAVLEPLIAEMRTIVEAAEARRTRAARADAMLTGFVDLVVRHQRLVRVLAADPGVRDALGGDLGLDGLIGRQVALLAGAGPDGWIRAGVAMAGIAGLVGPRTLEMDQDALRQSLIGAGRHTLGLRPPRRT